ncbi:MAG: (Fe-S)-binding protein [Gammaproteobacteria bacterium]|nr:(Fe-S)-binding protein [Gammaproteobacteria bacterium]
MSVDLRTRIKREADQCVKCGLCLPHCPTYAKTLDEGDSPRGRIALIQALVEERLPASDRLAYHLDRCLACRACERACPSGVHYGPLIDSARALLEQKRPSRRAGSWLHAGLLAWTTGGPGRLRAAIRLLRLYRASGLRRVIRGSGLFPRLARMETLFPDPPSAPAGRNEYHPPVGEARGQVALFTGCVTDLADPAVLDASIRLLRLAGYGVHLPPGQGCCGALHLHAGDLDRAQTLARRNLSAFNALTVDAVLYTASGCGATLREYAAGPGRDKSAPGPFSAPVMDVTQFLAAIEWPAHLAPAPLEQRAAIQDPCLQRNVLRDTTPPYRLLARIPALETVALPGNERCCGAAGAYMLEQPEMADALRADKLEALRECGAELLVTSNIGCAIHLAAGLRAAGSAVEVVHPVVLLERQIADRL